MSSFTPLDLNRRTLLRLGAGAAVAQCAPRSFAASLGAALAPRSEPRHLVLLWLEGGPSQFETFDPKSDPSTGGGAKQIATDIQDWSFHGNLPQLAERAQQLCVLRALSSREGNHARARELVKTGHIPTPTVSYPSLGAVVAHELGARESELPSSVQIGGSPSAAGYLGVEYAPFVLGDPERPIDNLDYARGVDGERMDRREKTLDVLERSFADRGGAAAVESYGGLRAKARRLVETKLRRAFDLDEEKESLRDRYGRNSFGQGCLMARRLIESGVSAVEVVLGGWDTHDDNFRRSAELCATLDPAFSALLDDLQDRELWERTVVLCVGEFGRTPEITASDGRNHWPRNFCAALAGGGLRGGFVHGTTDERGEQIVAGATTVADLHATVAKALGLDLDREFFVGKRPVKLVDPEGSVVRELLQ